MPSAAAAKATKAAKDTNAGSQKTHPAATGKGNPTNKTKSNKATKPAAAGADSGGDHGDDLKSQLAKLMGACARLWFAVSLQCCAAELQLERTRRKKAEKTAKTRPVHKAHKAAHDDVDEDKVKLERPAGSAGDDFCLRDAMQLRERGAFYSAIRVCGFF